MLKHNTHASQTRKTNPLGAHKSCSPSLYSVRPARGRSTASSSSPAPRRICLRSAHYGTIGTCFYEYELMDTLFLTFCFSMTFHLQSFQQWCINTNNDCSNPWAWRYRIKWRWSSHGLGLSMPPIPQFKTFDASLLKEIYTNTNFILSLIIRQILVTPSDTCYIGKDHNFSQKCYFDCHGKRMNVCDV